MPVYNTSDTLRETLQSIAAQKFRDFELICIDDSSNDESLMILEEFRRVDNRVRVFSNEYNMGAAYCRNYGFSLAKGKYVIFLDSDDYFREDMLLALYHTAIHNDADVCMADYENMIDESGYFSTKLSQLEYSNRVFNYNEISVSDMKEFVIAPWNKLIKKSFLEKEKIKFQSLSNSNDVVFSMLLYMTAKKMSIVNEKALIKFLNTHSDRRITNNRKPINEYVAFVKLLEEANKRGYDRKQFELIYYEMIIIFLWQLSSGEADGIYYTFLKDEGIAELLNKGGVFFDDINREYNDILGMIINKEYSSKWFNKFDYRDISLWNTQNEIWKIWDRYENTYVWGMGNFGTKLISAAKRNNKKIKKIFDKTNHKSLTIDNEEIVSINFSMDKIEENSLIIIAMNDLTESVLELVRVNSEKIDFMHMLTTSTEFVFEKI